MNKKKNTLRMVWFFMNHYKLHFALLILLAAIIGILETLNLAIMYPILSYGLEADAAPNVFLNIIYSIGNYVPISDPLVKYCILFIFLAVFVRIWLLLIDFILFMVFWTIGVFSSDSIPTEIPPD